MYKVFDVFLLLQNKLQAFYYESVKSFLEEKMSGPCIHNKSYRILFVL